MSNLVNRAVLVGLTISNWSAKKTDKDATKVATKHYGADSDAGIFTLNQIPKMALSPIQASIIDARSRHNTLSAKWANGANIVSIEGLQRWRDEMRFAKQNFEMVCRDFFNDYDSKWLPLARQKNAGLHKEYELPTLEQVKLKFAFKTSVLPVPNVADWRVDVPDSQMAILRQSLTAEIQESLINSQKDAFMRIVETLQNYITKVGEYVPGDGLNRAQSPFKQATVRHIQELAELLPALNIAKDSRLDDLKKDSKSFLNTMPKT